MNFLDWWKTQNNADDHNLAEAEKGWKACEEDMRGRSLEIIVRANDPEAKETVKKIAEAIQTIMSFGKEGRDESKNHKMQL